MSRYVLLRGKQLLRLLPWILVAALVLGAAAAATVGAVQAQAEAKEQKYAIALCGVREDPLISMAVLAMRTMDETRYSVQLLTMDEPEAIRALQAGEIAAYAVLPEGFLDAALGGNVPTIRFVTQPGGPAVNTVFERHITQIIADILLAAQKGSYGAYFALYDNGSREQALGALNALCIEYVELALRRGQTYRVEVLGVGSGLPLSRYLVCGFAVLLSCLLCLAFAPLMVQRDGALGRVLAARGCPAWAQALIDLVCMQVGLWLPLGAVFLLLAASGAGIGLRFWDIVPVALLTGTMSFLAFSLARDVVSGVMAQFAAAAAMCFVSGCMYPVTFLPVAVQRIAAWLPTGICREYLADRMAGGECWRLWILFLCCGAFGAAAVWLRSRRLLSEGRHGA